MERWKPEERASKSITKRWNCIEGLPTVMGRLKRSIISARYIICLKMQKALEKYNEALPLKRAVGDRKGEAKTLYNIGSVYDSLGEKQKALEKLQ